MRVNVKRVPRSCQIGSLLFQNDRGIHHKDSQDGGRSRDQFPAVFILQSKDTKGGFSQNDFDNRRIILPIRGEELCSFFLMLFAAFWTSHTI